MRLAEECGFNVANVSLEHYRNHMALVVERFDRKLVSNVEIKRRHINADFAESCHLSRSYVTKRLKRMTETMLVALPQETTKIADKFGHMKYFEEYQKIVVQRCEHLNEQSKYINKTRL